jgi:hypothetical protein
MQQDEELKLCLNELNKFNYDDNDKNNEETTKISREKAWEYLIKAEQLLMKTEKEESSSSRSNEINDYNDIKINDTDEDDILLNLYQDYQMKLTETKSNLIGLDDLNEYLSNLLHNFIEHYFNLQFLFSTKNNKSRSKQQQHQKQKIQNTLIYGREGSGIMSLLTNLFIKYQNLFKLNTNEQPLKIFKFDMLELLSNQDKIELIFKAISIFNKNKQPVIIVLINLEYLFQNETTQLKLHLIADLLYECNSKPNRIFIAISHLPWHLHPCIIYRFEKNIYCSEFSLQDKKQFINSRLVKYKQLDLENDLLNLTENYLLNGKQMHILFEKHLKPLLLKSINEQILSKRWKILRTEIDVLKRFKKYNKKDEQEEEKEAAAAVEKLKNLKKQCLDETVNYLTTTTTTTTEDDCDEIKNKFISFKNAYRSQLDLP